MTTVTATDDDLTGTVSYSIVGGADAALFNIDAASGALSFISAPDAESGGDNVYDVVVQASDGERSSSQAIAVTVSDVNEFDPVIAGGDSARSSISENGSCGHTTVSATDADLRHGELLDRGRGGCRQVPDRHQHRRAVLRLRARFEAPTDAGGNNVYDVVVQASDGSRSDTQAIAVSVGNVNDNPPAITSNGGGATASLGDREHHRRHHT